MKRACVRVCRVENASGFSFPELTLQRSLTLRLLIALSKCSLSAGDSPRKCLAV